MSSAQVVALFGGSFDPPHLGHLFVATWALSQGADAVWVVPTFGHALKTRSMTPFEERHTLCTLAFAPLRNIEVSRIEAELGGESRTLRTVEALRSRHPDITFRLLVGADILEEAHRWHRWDRICELAPPWVIGRDGCQAVASTLALPDVSSSAIRATLASGDSADAWLPSSVAAHIRRSGLYGETS